MASDFSTFYDSFSPSWTLRGNQICSNSLAQTKTKLKFTFDLMLWHSEKVVQFRFRFYCW